ncbi:Beta-N-acetylhexosaminidase [Microbacterium trichothecenolyticum]|uniref:beta-N-acetylhexosaminidase n=1 Tax=Microbacterium trichothecenolyticum TaxID=69370 RepID=A0A0M2HAA6_MICTR|nr:family 20 glycosylhydrolase [Microbacterium trichothecenolyticum]KJL41104.1 Beta-N-acetylhexosaminidase [Microbacterium trichothecenolyticum]
MNRRRGRAVAAAVLAAALLAGCTPVAQNGDTVSLPAVVPAPVSIEAGPDAPFRLSSATAVTGEADAAAALSAIVEARTALTLASGDGAGIELRIDARSDAPESYRIAVDEASVTVTGADAAGLFYGVQTLGQLIARDGDEWTVSPVTIEDAPRFAYRGVMLDVARHFHPVETVKAYIDHAASLKFNALHLHLTDDQGWRVHLDSRPELTEKASGTSVGGDPGGFYTKDDYREIVEYADSRHMIVVPEIDMPGHTHAVGLAYPELAEDPSVSDHMREVIRDYGGDEPRAGAPYDGMAVGFSSLKIHDEATYDFVADIFGELAAMTPGPYLHFGGDESLSTTDEDFAEFVGRASEIISDLGKTPVAWHEAGAAVGIADTTVGQYWGFLTPQEGAAEKATAFVDNGAQLILSPADAIYLDMKYPNGPELGLTWANGPTSVERAYSWEPSDVLPGVDDSGILGVEAPLWTETIRTAADIDTMAFPRAAAAAEAAWSPATGASDLRTWASFRQRVGALGPLWTSMGIGFHPSDEIPWVTE